MKKIIKSILEFIFVEIMLGAIVLTLLLLLNVLMILGGCV